MPLRRSALWSDPRVKPPYGVTEVDWNHPLAFDLGLLLNEGAAVPRWLGAGGGALTVGGAPVGTGTGLVFNGTSAIAWWNTCLFASAAVPRASAFLQWRGWTTITGGAYFSTFAGSSTDSNIIWGMSDNGATSQDIEVNYRDSTGAAFAAQTSGLTLRNGARHSMLSVLNGAGASGHTVYVDGVSAASVTTATATGIAAADRTALGGLQRSSSALFVPFEAELLYLYARPLNASLALWLAIEPYAMLKPIVRRRYSVAAAGGPSPFVPNSIARLYAPILAQ